jgi:hypothetical protein
MSDNLDQKMQDQLRSENILSIGAGMVIAFPACMILLAAYCLAQTDSSDNTD